MARFEKVGYIGVDSGQVMLIDPCYIKKDFESEFKDKPDLNYAGACEVTLSKAGCGNFGGDGMAFATRTAFGDGTYPVYIKRDESGMILEMKIKFA
jgi:hypothetical protein